MHNILKTLCVYLGANIAKVICTICEAVNSYFTYKNANIQNKIKEKEEKNDEAFNKKIDDVTKNGTLEDLLDLKRK